MTWLAWRQFRVQAAWAAAATVAVTVLLVLTQGHIAEHASNLSTRYQSLRLLGTGLIGVPPVLGAFWGAPLIARELEAGTHRLAWTQSVTRSRWLAVKLAVVGLVAVVATAVFSLVFTWWSLPLDRLGNRIGTANFGQRGIAPIAYVLFALALGALLGAITRRTLPAMFGTLLGFFVVRFLFQLLVRPRLFPATTVSLPDEIGPPSDLPTAVSGAWVLARRSVDSTGHSVDLNSHAIQRAMDHTCHLTRASTQPDFVRCSNRLGLHELWTVQPASRFWALQGVEAAVFLAFAVALAALCFWWLRRRTA